MSKSLSESAAEILATSLGGAKKDPMVAGPGAGAEDLGGQTPTTEPETQGPKVSAKAKEAVTPKEGAPLSTKAVQKEEESSEEDLPELTEEEIDAYHRGYAEGMDARQEGKRGPENPYTRDNILRRMALD